MASSELRWLRLSLVFVWLWTAFASLWEWHGQSLALLAKAIDPAWWLHPLGPLSKNLPIAAALLVLWRLDTRT